VEPYAWAFDHLSSTEQSLFLSLSTFAGPFTREMALDLVDAPRGIDEATAFDRLVRSSMVARESAGSARFRLFEPAREFARSRLDPARLDALRNRHAALMLTRARSFGPLIRTDQEARAIEVLRADFADHRQAFSWLLSRGRLDEAAELTVALFQFCHFQLLAEAYEWPKQLNQSVTKDSPLFVDIGGAAALGAWFEGDPEKSIRLAEDVIRSAPASRRGSLFWAQIALVDSFGYTGRLDDAAEHFLNFIAATAQSGEPFWQILGLGYQAISFLLFGRTDEAMIRAERAAALARQLNNPDCSHWALHCLGRVLAETDPEAASQAFEEAIDATRRVGSRFNLSLDLVEWAGLRRQLGDPRSAAQALLELLDLLVGAGNRSQLAQAFFESARLLMDESVVELAFVLVEGRLGLPEMPKGMRAAAVDEAFVTKVRSAVGDQRARLSVRARGLTEQDLVILCRSGLEDIARGRMPSEGGKTRRLQDVAIVYTDLVASTELNVRVGDAQFVDLLREHNAIVRRRLRHFGGREFTFTGDGVGAMFSDVEEALLFAIGLQTDLDDANSAHPTYPLRVRVGLARGEALENEGNLFGQTVVRAVRICAAAAAGQVLAGEDVTITADPAVATFTPVGPVPLKGFGTSVLLYQASTPQESLLSVP
jgi:class 3 adenylate cyclase/tetratricopeptide (TPR) repeat protein